MCLLFQTPARALQRARGQVGGRLELFKEPGDRWEGGLAVSLHFPNEESVSAMVKKTVSVTTGELMLW